MRMIAGSLAEARAIAQRCCMPPDSSYGCWSATSERPTISRYRSESARRSSLATPAMRGPISTLPRTVSHGKSVGAWNTMPRSGAGAGDGGVVDRDRPLRRREEAADELEQRGLAAAGRTDETDELARLDSEVDPGQSRGRPLVFAEHVRHVAHVDAFRTGPPGRRGAGRLLVRSHVRLGSHVRHLTERGGDELVGEVRLEVRERRDGLHAALGLQELRGALEVRRRAGREHPACRGSRRRPAPLRSRKIRSFIWASASSAVMFSWRPTASPAACGSDRYSSTALFCWSTQVCTASGYCLGELVGDDREVGGELALFGELGAGDEHGAVLLEIGERRVPHVGGVDVATLPGGEDVRRLQVDDLDLGRVDAGRPRARRGAL